jgi:hypothetical protein
VFSRCIYTWPKHGGFDRATRPICTDRPWSRFLCRNILSFDSLLQTMQHSQKDLHSPTQTNICHILDPPSNQALRTMSPKKIAWGSTAPLKPMFRCEALCRSKTKRVPTPPYFVTPSTKHFNSTSNTNPLTGNSCSLSIPTRSIMENTI